MYIIHIGNVFTHRPVRSLNTRKLVRGRGTDRSHGYIGNGEFTIIHTTPGGPTSTQTNLNLAPINNPQVNGVVSGHEHSLSNGTVKSFYTPAYSYPDGYTTSGTKSQEVHGGSVLLAEIDSLKKVSERTLLIGSYLHLYSTTLKLVYLGRFQYEQIQETVW